MRLLLENCIRLLGDEKSQVSKGVEGDCSGRDSCLSFLSQIVVSACYFLARLFLKAPTSSHVDKEEGKEVDDEEEGEEREEAEDRKEEMEKQEEEEGKGKDEEEALKSTPANTATDKILAAANLKVGLLLVSFS